MKHRSLNSYFFSVKVVFDLTKEIFGEIFAEDPNLNQPIWMKPYRNASAYFRRVKDPNDLDEIKVGRNPCHTGKMRWKIGY